MNNILELQRLRDERNALETQLFQAQKMEAIGQLAGGVAHDFNNLLGVVVGQLDLIAGQMDQHVDLQEQVRLCKRTVEQTATLTRGMLDFLRDQSLRPATFRMSDVVGDMLYLLRHSIGRMITVRTENAPNLWPCDADPTQMQNAVLNLAINARDAMPKGGEIVVSTHNARLTSRLAAAIPGAKPGNYAVLSVRDSGTGMSPEILARACEPFFTTKPLGKGTGLGLSMVRGFASRSGGHMRIASTLGKGTTIEIYLPRSFGEVQQKPRWVRHTDPAPIAGDKPMLVVDDDPDMRAMVVALLSKIGHAAFAASNAAEALAMLDAHPDIALTFLDVVLPDDAEIERLNDRLRAMPQVKVVHMSGHSRQSAIGHGQLASDTPVLEKPFGREELLLAIRTACG